VPGRPLEPAQVPVQSHTRSCLLQAESALASDTEEVQVQTLYWDHSFLASGGRANWYGFCSVVPAGATARVIGYGLCSKAVLNGRWRQVRRPWAAAGEPAPGRTRLAGQYRSSRPHGAAGLASGS